MDAREVSVPALPSSITPEALMLDTDPPASLLLDPEGVRVHRVSTSEALRLAL
jgi:hypothetical protein